MTLRHNEEKLFPRQDLFSLVLMIEFQTILYEGFGLRDIFVFDAG